MDLAMWGGGEKPNFRSLFATAFVTCDAPDTLYFVKTYLSSETHVPTDAAQSHRSDACGRALVHLQTHARGVPESGRLFYLSIPPSSYAGVSEGLHKHCRLGGDQVRSLDIRTDPLSTEGRIIEGWACIMIPHHS